MVGDSYMANTLSLWEAPQQLLSSLLLALGIADTLPRAAWLKELCFLTLSDPTPNSH